MTAPSGRVIDCPYFLCGAKALVVGEGTEEERVRSHKYEGFVVCPGTGYRVRQPRMEQERLMADRAVTAHLPRGTTA